MVPSQSERIEERWRDALQQCGMQGFHVTKRDADIGKMGTHGWEQLREFLLIPVLHQAQADAHIGTGCFNRTQPTRVRATGSGVTEEMK